MMLSIKLLFIIFIYLEGEVVGLDDQWPCGDDWDWYEFGTHCYYFSYYGNTWAEAEEDCVATKDSQLASIHSEAENTFISNTIKNFFDAGSIGYWFGLRLDKMPWIWSTGASLNFSNFASGYPDGKGNCVILNDWTKYEWTDQSCKEQYNYICEKSGTTCTADWIPYASGECLYLSSDTKTWQDARTECINFGAELLYINDETENTNLTSMMTNLASSNPYWIGLYTKPTKWIDGSDIIVEDYEADEPDGQGSCLYMNKDGWSDAMCGFDESIGNIYYICKKITPTATCGSEWISAKLDLTSDNCYLISTDTTTNWYNAKTKCEENTADLVTISDATENNFIKNALEDAKYYWIGVNTWHNNAVWTDHSDYDYNNFYDGYPTGNGLCVIAAHQKVQIFPWVDGTCSTTYRYICKKSAEGWCLAETFYFQNATNTTVTFPDTYSGYSTITIEKCSQESTDFQDFSYGSRFCNLSGIWESPVWISSCNVTLQDLEVTAENVNQLSSDMVIMTSQPYNLTDVDVEAALKVVQQSLDISTTAQISKFYVDTMSNLIEWTITNTAEEISKKILQLIDDIASVVQIEDSTEFSRISPQIAVHVIQPDPTSSAGLELILVDVERGVGFRQDQINFIKDCMNHKSNNSNICLSHNDTTQITDQRISFYAFFNHSLFQGNNTNSSEVNSDVVLSASTSLQLIQVNIRFNLKNEIAASDCGYWNESQLRWTDFPPVINSQYFIECQVNHLTNFASLVGFEVDAINEIALNVITLVGCILSLLCQIATIVFYFKSKRSIKSNIYGSARGIILCNFAFSLCFLNLILIISEIPTIKTNSNSCQVIAIISHFALLSVCTWTSADAFNIYLGTNHPLFYRFRIQLKKYVIILMTICWGIPMLLVVPTAGKKPEIYGLIDPEITSQCWIQFDWIIYLVIIPISIFLSFNMILFAAILYSARFKARPSGQKPYEKLGTIKFAFTLLFMVGGTWIIGLVIIPMANLSYKAGLAFAYIFTIVNSVQGVMLFVLQYKRTWKTQIGNPSKTPQRTNELTNINKSE